jgi:large subunit ribosomal protein L21
MDVEPGSRLDLGDVLAVSRNGDMLFGRPVLEGARVVARVQDQIKDDKIIVFKYKRKVRYRRKKGHRQRYTRLLIMGVLLAGEDDALLDGEAQEISVSEIAVETQAPKSRRRRVPTKSPAESATPIEDSGVVVEEAEKVSKADASNADPRVTPEEPQKDEAEKPAPRPRRRPSSGKPPSMDLEPKGDV